MKKLSKQAQDELDAHKRTLGYKLNDAFRNFYQKLQSKHGECRCRVRGVYKDACGVEHGISHLAHAPLDADLLESALQSWVTEFLSAGVIVKVRP